MILNTLFFIYYSFIIRDQTTVNHYYTYRLQHSLWPPKAQHLILEMQPQKTLMSFGAIAWLVL